jgi:hypothetical protein
MVSMVDWSWLYFAIPGDGRRKGKWKLTLLRAPLLDSFRQKVLRHLAHPTSYATDSGVLSIDGAMKFAGDSEWKNT